MESTVDRNGVFTTTAAPRIEKDSLPITGIVLGSVAGFLLLVTCFVSAVKATRDRRASLSRIEACRQRKANDGRVHDMESADSSDNLVDGERLANHTKHKPWPASSKVVESEHETQVTVHNGKETSPNGTAANGIHESNQTSGALQNGHTPVDDFATNLDVQKPDCKLNGVNDDDDEDDGLKHHESNGFIVKDPSVDKQDAPQDDADISSEQREALPDMTEVNEYNQGDPSGNGNGASSVEQAEIAIDDARTITPPTAGANNLGEENATLKPEEIQCLDSLGNSNEDSLVCGSDKEIIECSLHRIETRGVDNLSFSQERSSP